MMVLFIISFMQILINFVVVVVVLSAVDTVHLPVPTDYTCWWAGCQPDRSRSSHHLRS